MRPYKFEYDNKVDTKKRLYDDNTRKVEKRD